MRITFHTASHRINFVARVLFTPIRSFVCLFACRVCSFTYKSAAELNGSPYEGRVSTYGGGGYVAYLTVRRNDSKSTSLVNDLIAKNWIDRLTRAIFVDLTVYNRKVEQFCVVR
jgi:hypothetical protein